MEVWQLLVAVLAVVIAASALLYRAWRNTRDGIAWANRDLAGVKKDLAEIRKGHGVASLALQTGEGGERWVGSHYLPPALLAVPVQDLPAVDVRSLPVVPARSPLHG